MHKIDLSIIVVNYNAGTFLQRCFLSIEKNISNKISYEVIVVDNASTDESINEVKSSKLKVQSLTIIRNEVNVGFSKANNIGLKKATGRYILFLNPDTELREKTVETMIKFMDENENAGAATCFVSLPDGKVDDASHRGFPTPWNAFSYFSGLARIFPSSMFFNGYNLGWGNLDKVHEIDALAGAFMFVRREAGDEVGWWDEDYFFYGEDLDFCYKLKDKGWKIYFVPTVSVLHHKGVSGGIRKESQHVTTADNETKLRVTKARFDAMKTFYKKHYMHKYPKLVTWAIMRAISLKQKKSLRLVS